jgi:hypothetical protein
VSLADLKELKAALAVKQQAKQQQHSSCAGHPHHSGHPDIATSAGDHDNATRTDSQGSLQPNVTKNKNTVIRPGATLISSSNINNIDTANDINSDISRSSSSKSMSISVSNHPLSLKVLLKRATCVDNSSSSSSDSSNNSSTFVNTHNTSILGAQHEQPRLTSATSNLPSSFRTPSQDASVLATATTAPTAMAQLAAQMTLHSNNNYGGNASVAEDDDPFSSAVISRTGFGNGMGTDSFLSSILAKLGFMFNS